MKTLILFLIFIPSLGRLVSPVTYNHTHPGMALTLEDFLKHTKQNAEEAEKQRELDRQERATERENDKKEKAAEYKSQLEAIDVLVKKGVQDEVTRVLNPIQEKNDNRIGTLEKDMAQIKNLLTHSKTPSFQELPGHQPEPSEPAHVHPVHPLPVQNTLPSIGNISSGVGQTLSRVRRILAFQPILTRDVERQFRMNDNLKDNDEAMIAAAKEFIHYELKCKFPDQPKIVKVFPPVNSKDFDRLYVEFDTEQSASYIASFARFIKKKDHQVSLYVPSCFQQRFQAFNTEAFMLRNAPGLHPGDVRTRVKYGSYDFHLLSKPRDGCWSRVNLDTSNFPPLHEPGSSSSQSPSPPPGRPRDSPPPSRPKRGASSPLESENKSHKTSTPSPTQVTSEQSAHAANTASAQPNASVTALDESEKSEEESQCSSLPSTSPGPERSLCSLGQSSLPQLAQDMGEFAQTAVCSPSLSTNKHFTFDTRRMSLPASAGNSESLN